MVLPVQDQDKDFTNVSEDLVTQKYRETRLSDNSNQVTVEVNNLEVYTVVDQLKHAEVITDFKNTTTPTCQYKMSL